MFIDKNEAVDIFRKWADEPTVIRWQGSFPHYAFSGWGRVSHASAKEIRLIALNTESELVVRLTAPTHFHYADSRTVTGEEKKFKECIVMSFGEIPDEGVADTIALAALDSP